MFDVGSRGGQVAESTVLTGADVHVWHGHAGLAGAGTGEPLETDLAILSADERARCQRFLRQVDRARFAASHAAQRRLLARYLEVDPAEVRFGRVRCCECGSAEHGPPRVDWPATDITFNLSGSGVHWLLALTRERRVGADIEVPRAIDTGQMARACLTAAEQQDLSNQQEPARLGMFYRCWTRKEAVLKACGIGLPGSMRGLEVAPGSGSRVAVRHACKAGPGLWVVEDLAAGPDPAGSEDPAVTRPLPGAAEIPGWLGAVAQPAAGAGRVWFREADGAGLTVRAPSS
jgi:4'-phosphopantetheinyl transferase